ncbi:hypothetical protein OAF27_03290, partial [Verrucomicrobiales bacterium]|nr:hypothetical protein [Verrucomicrobiales bacterium]
AENATTTSLSSSIASVMTRSAGTPFANWATDNNIDPPTNTSDFDGDSITDLQEYLFATDPAEPGSFSEAFEFEVTSDGFLASVRQSLAPGVTFDYIGSTDLIFGEAALDEGASIGQYRVLATERFGSFQERLIEVNTTGMPRFFLRVRAEMP